MSYLRDAVKGVLKVIRAETFRKSVTRIHTAGLSKPEQARAQRNLLLFMDAMDWLIGDQPSRPAPPPVDTCVEHQRSWPCAECERLAS